MNKIYSTTFYCHVICILFLLSMSTFCFAQGNPWDEQNVFIDETDFSGTSLNVDVKFANSNSIFKEEPEIIGNRMDITANTGGFFGLNIVKPEDRQMNDAPVLPGSPDAPVNSGILYLIIVGLTYGGYAIFKIKRIYP